MPGCTATALFAFAMLAMSKIAWGLPDCGDSGLTVVGAHEPLSRTAVEAHPPWVAPTLAELRTGAFLIANHNLNDVTFSRTVVLLIEYGPKGALGLVINRPTDYTLASVLPELDELADRSDRLYFGGPVSLNTLLLVLASPVPQSTAILKGVYLTASVEGLTGVFSDRSKEPTFRAFAGYAGWRAGQLDDEIARGDWLVSPGDAISVFAVDSRRVWNQLYRRYSGVWAGKPPSLAGCELRRYIRLVDSSCTGHTGAQSFSRSHSIPCASPL